MGQPVVHFEVQGSDREALTRFYEQLFDWKTTDVSEMNYTMVETGGDGGINGGIGPTPEGAPGGVTFYVHSDDVAGSFARVGNLADGRSPDRWTCPMGTSGRCSRIPRVTW
jgi:predicted enzyme related to lactoylglutathione lyase